MAQKRPTIDPEFKAVLPALTADEKATLEAQIKEAGKCTSPLIVWEGEGILVDGHNRLEICERCGYSYTLEYRKFDSREAAMLWIWQHQVGRRNLSDVQKARLALRFKPQIAVKAKENIVAGGAAGGKSKGSQKSGKAVAQSVKTDREVAKIAGVSHATINQVEYIERHATPDIKKRLDAGQISINRAYEDTKVFAPAQKNKAPAAKRSKGGSTKLSLNLPTPEVALKLPRDAERIEGALVSAFQDDKELLLDVGRRLVARYK